METKNREIRIIAFDDLSNQDEKKYGLNGSPTQVQRIFPPEANNHREMWKDNAGNLTDKLFSKIKELKFV
jgi:electron transfer flavoprotein beta subunit